MCAVSVRLTNVFIFSKQFPLLFSLCSYLLLEFFFFFFSVLSFFSYTSRQCGLWVILTILLQTCLFHLRHSIHILSFVILVISRCQFSLFFFTVFFKMVISESTVCSQIVLFFFTSMELSKLSQNIILEDPIILWHKILFKFVYIIRK